MSTTKLSLNLVGEIINIEPPSTFRELKQKISENSNFKKSIYELKLYYNKESKPIYIDTEEDYKDFLDTKINQIQIDTKKNVYLYQDNLITPKEEKSNDEKKLNELIKQNDEYKKLLSTKFTSEKQEITEISKQIKELFAKRKKLFQYIKVEKEKIIKMKKSNDKSIAELEKKIGLKNMNKNKTVSNMNSYAKKRGKLKKINYLENIIQNYKNDSLEKTKNSQPNSTPPELKVIMGNKINYKINLKRRTSPNVRHNFGKIKKLIIFNEHKNTTNPFNDYIDESKIKKPKQIKISQIINNKIKSINDISLDKNILKKNILTQERTKENIKTKFRKGPQKHQSERNIYFSKNSKEIATETLNKLINKHQKYEQLLPQNNERNTNHKNNEKANGKKRKKNSKNDNHNSIKKGK